MGSAVIGSAPGAALFFVTYEGFKSSLRHARETGNGYFAGYAGLHDGLFGAWSEPIEHMAAASAGEIAACAVRVPTEVIKQRAQAAQYGSSAAALRAILNQRGAIGVTGIWREMYRGWNVTIMREVPFTVIQFPLWEAMKEWKRRTSGREEISAVQSGLFGSLAGAVAAGVTTPLDVLKTRIMLARHRTSTLRLLQQILKESGVGAFFKGVGPRITWISAGGAIFLGTYQWACNALGGL